MGNIEVVEVETSAQLDEFIEYPNRLYRDCKQYVWPLRFTSVLVRRHHAGNGSAAVNSDGWLFHQIQFSFATTRFPDVRNL